MQVNLKLFNETYIASRLKTAELAELADVTARTISKFFAGEKVYCKTIHKIGQALGIAYEDRFISSPVPLDTAGDDTHYSKPGSKHPGPPTTNGHSPDRDTENPIPPCSPGASSAGANDKNGGNSK